MPTTITRTQVNTNTQANSCKVIAVNVRTCLDFDAMWKAHPMNWQPPEPAPWRHSAKGVLAAVSEGEPVYENQCAIKMSFALEAGGLSLSSYPKNRIENRPVERLNGQKKRGALAAQELAAWLSKALAKPEELEPAAAQKLVSGKKGIVFFKDFWTRDGETTPQGDHIDLWDGKQIPGYPPGNPLHQGTLDYFARSRAIWFWEVK